MSMNLGREKGCDICCDQNDAPASNKNDTNLLGVIMRQTATNYMHARMSSRRRASSFQQQKSNGIFFVLRRVNFSVSFLKNQNAGNEKTSLST